MKEKKNLHMPNNSKLQQEIQSNMRVICNKIWYRPETMYHRQFLGTDSEKNKYHLEEMSET